MLPRLGILLCVSFLVSCSAEDERTGQLSAGDSTDTESQSEATTNATASASDDGTDNESTHVSQETDSETAVCDEQSFSIVKGPVKVMILQDVSKSMNQPPASPKWNQAVAALSIILAEPAYDNILWGFDRFPDGSDYGQLFRGCGVKEKPPFDADVDQADDIAAWLSDPSNTPSGNATPLYCAIKNYLTDTYAPKFLSTDYNRYLLVVSDGQDNCNVGCNVNAQDGASAAAFTDLVNQLSGTGVNTFVIGFGEEVFGDQVAEAQLSAIAAAGGTQFDEFLKAGDQDELTEALGLIAGSVVTCTYQIADVSEAADPSKVNFQFDGKTVPWDQDCAAGIGWSWTSDTHDEVIFCDEACKQLEDGQVKTVTATFGCPSSPVI